MFTDQQVARARKLCLDQAQGFIEAAERLGNNGYSHIIYHLSLLALEEVGKAGMLTAKAVRGSTDDATWIDRWIDNHRRKLQWAVWSPLIRIDPSDFERARQFAEQAHAKRLASLYVDATAELTDLPPSEQVQPEEAKEALSLARSRLDFERSVGERDYRPDDLARWFLDTMDTPDKARQMLSPPFIAQYEASNGDVRKWVRWARDELDRLERQDRDLLERELARPGVRYEHSKPRWRASSLIYTPSHSLRPKVLTRWNERIQPIQLIWSGKKDQLVLQIALNDNEPLTSIPGKFTTLAKLTVCCLSIGSMGYFWFQRPGFEQRMFKEARDLELDRQMEVSFASPDYWGNGRVVALTEQLIDHALHCLMAFTPLTDAEAEPIFAPYLHGLALIAKSDPFYNFDLLARHAFAHSLAGALRHFGGWDGRPETFDACLHERFSPIIPEREYREQVFRVLKNAGDPSETSLANVRTAKQLSDLYLIECGRRQWQGILERQGKP